MSEKKIKQLAGVMDKEIWKNPERSVRECLTFYRDNWTMRPVMGGGDRPMPCPPPPDKIVAFILRGGEPLSKEEKKILGVHPLTKIGKDASEHFTDKGLVEAREQAEYLANAISSVEVESDRLTDWGKWGTKMVEFSPAPDGCPLCMSLAGDYPVEKCPIPVLDTHLGCRCSIRPAESEVDGDYDKPQKASAGKNITVVGKIPVSDRHSRHKKSIIWKTLKLILRKL